MTGGTCPNCEEFVKYYMDGTFIDEDGDEDGIWRCEKCHCDIVQTRRQKKREANIRAHEFLRDY